MADLADLAALSSPHMIIHLHLQMADLAAFCPPLHIVAARDAQECRRVRRQSMTTTRAASSRTARAKLVEHSIEQ
jgi:hypothetical protein